MKDRPVLLITCDAPCTTTAVALIIIEVRALLFAGAFGPEGSPPLTASRGTNVQKTQKIALQNRVNKFHMKGSNDSLFYECLYNKERI